MLRDACSTGTYVNVHTFRFTAPSVPDTISAVSNTRKKSSAKHRLIIRPIVHPVRIRRDLSFSSSPYSSTMLVLILLFWRHSSATPSLDRSNVAKLKCKITDHVINGRSDKTSRAKHMVHLILETGHEWFFFWLIKKFSKEVGGS